VTVVPVEENNTERALVTPDREPYEMERREAALVTSAAPPCSGRDTRSADSGLCHRGNPRPLYSDLRDETTRELVEAKGSAGRDHLRAAVGQLLDYGRFAGAASHAVLLPTRPRHDLLAYLASVQVAAVHPAGDGWVRIEPPMPSTDDDAHPGA